MLSVDINLRNPYELDPYDLQRVVEILGGEKKVEGKTLVCVYFREIKTSLQEQNDVPSKVTK
jgi:hypothetical protein